MMALDPTYQDLERKIQALETEILAYDAMEAEVNADLAFYREMFYHTEVAVILTDADTGEVITCNKKAHEELGYTKAEYIALSLKDYVFDGPDTDGIGKKAQDKPWTYTKTLKPKHGDSQNFKCSAVLLEIDGRRCVQEVRYNVTDQKNIEKALKDSEARYRDVLDNLNEGYYEVNLAGNFSFVHDASLWLVGYTPEELIGRSFHNKMMTPETAEKVFLFYGEIYEKGKTDKTITYPVTRKDGSPATFEASGSLMKNDKGVITGFQGIIRDVTKRMQMETALRESETLYRTLFEHAGVAMTLTDAKSGHRIAYNKMAYEQLGYTEEEYKQIRPQFLAVSEKEYSELITELMEKGFHTNYIQLRKKNGEIGVFLRSVVKMRIAGKTCFHTIRIDVSDQKKIENELKISEEKFRAVFSIAPDPVFLWKSENKRIIDANPAAEQYSGYAKQELLKMAITDLADPESSKRQNEIFDGLMKSNFSFNETIYRKKNGKKVVVEINSRVIDPMDGQIVLSVIRDVTKRKKEAAELALYQTSLEKLIQERTKELVDAQEKLIKREKMAVLGRLTKTVSQELRHPLEEMKATQGRLREKIGKPEKIIEKHIIRIRNQMMICDTIVSDLTEYTSTTELDMMPTDLISWITDLLEISFEGESIRLKRNFAKDLPEIGHDCIKMQQVLMNVLDNAKQGVQAMADLCGKERREYEPEIEVAVGHHQAMVFITVSDNGIGMEKSILDKAFEPLFTTRARGVGLGLANAKKIVTAHGGEIKLDSTPNKGSVVHIQLPVSANMNITYETSTY